MTNGQEPRSRKPAGAEGHPEDPAEAAVWPASRFKMKRHCWTCWTKSTISICRKRMLEAEFKGIWEQVEQDKANGQLAEEDAEQV